MPPLPAARLTDMTVHGGNIIPPNAIKTIIEMMPAARLGDMHLCPMVTPGVPPIPHVGGPIIMGAPTVLVEFLPAARVMDQCVCVGPPDMIAKGAAKTIIGDGGAAGASMATVAPPAPPAPPTVPGVPAPPPIPGAAGFPAAGVALSAPAALCTKEGDPVDVATGRVLHGVIEFSTAGTPIVPFRRFYSSAEAAHDGPLGHGWRHSLGDVLETDGDYLAWKDAEGRRVLFPHIEVGAFLTHMDEGVTLTREGEADYRLTDGDGVERVFAPSASDPAGAASLLPLTLLRDAEGRTVRFEYGVGAPGAPAPLLALTDAAGNRYRFEYGGGGARLSAIHRRLAGETAEKTVARYEYDSAGNLSAALDALGQAERYRYDEKHRLVQRINRNGHAFYFQYDRQNRCTRAWGDQGVLDQSFIYDEEQPTTEVRDAATGATASYRFNEYGLVTEAADRVGGVTRTQYIGLRPHKVTGPDGGVRIAGHDGHGRVIASQSAAGVTAHVIYSPEGLPSLLDARGMFTHAQMVVPEGADEPAFIEVRHDSLPDPLLTARAAGNDALAFTDPTGATATLTLDAHDRPALVRRPSGAEWHWEYDALGRIAACHGPRTALHFAYDSLGRVARVSDAEEREHAFAYDPEGKLMAYRDPAGGVTRYEHRHPLGGATAVTDPLGTLVRMDYDRAGNCVALADGRGNLTRFARDPMGHVRRVDYPLGDAARLEYDAAGKLVALADRAGKTVTLGRDPDGRLTGLSAEGVTLSFAYDECGRLVAAEEREGSACSWEYDDLGRLVAETQDGVRVAYAYDPCSRLAGIDAPGYGTVRFAHDADGNLQSATDWANGEHRFAWEPDGSPAEHRHPNGLVSHYETTPAGLVSAVTVGRLGVTPLWTTRLSYDAHDALTECRDTDRGRSEYAYDATGRLSGATHAEGARRESFAYDKAGNLVEIDGDAFRHDAENRVEGVPHDTRGHVLELPDGDGTPGLRLTWDALGRLVRAEPAGAPAVTFAYDALGRRTAKRQGTRETRYLWAGDQLLSERTTENGRELARRDYLYRPGTFAPVAVRVNGVTYSVHADHRGAPARLTDSLGRVAWAAEYSAWGLATPDRDRSAGPDPLLRLPGQQFDPETGLHYNRHRYYHPGWGRYLSPDPLGYAAGLNLYAYAANDPVNESDPLGLAPGKGPRRSGPSGIAKGAGVPPPDAANATGTPAAQTPPTPQPGPAPTPAPEPLPTPAGASPCAVNAPAGGSQAANVASQAANFVPVVGDAKGIAEGVSGKDLVTGAPLSTTDRILGVGLGIVGLATLGAAGLVAKLGAKGLKALKGAKAAKAAKIAEEAAQAGKAAEAMKAAEAAGNAAKAGEAPTAAEAAGRVAKAAGAEATALGPLGRAAAGTGNFGVGSATRAEADALGREWVGEGYRQTSAGGYLSKDGLRQYRPPRPKPNSAKATTGVQANLERREIPKGPWTSNGHLDITD